VLAAVIAASLHYSENKAFFQLLRDARPVWLLVAASLQTATYIVEGFVWRQISAAAGFELSVTSVAKISIAKLFVDQAIPSGGLSGSVMTASALEKKRVPEPIIAAAVALERASGYAAYVIAVIAALVLGVTHGRLRAGVFIAAGLFTLFAISMSTGIVALAGSRWRMPKPLKRIKPLASLLSFVQQADRHLVRNPVNLSVAVGLQLLIVALDTSTMIAVIHSLRGEIPATGVFVSFMISSLFRTIGFMPGGLGTFEATSVLTLRMFGAKLPLALSATLLFRGLSYWLPMLPGMYFAKKLSTKKSHAPRPKPQASRRPKPQA
jgi:Mg2+-importing ATPase